MFFPYQSVLKTCFYWSITLNHMKLQILDCFDLKKQEFHLVQCKNNAHKGSAWFIIAQPTRVPSTHQAPFHPLRVSITLTLNTIFALCVSGITQGVLLCVTLFARHVFEVPPCCVRLLVNSHCCRVFHCTAMKFNCSSFLTPFTVYGYLGYLLFLAAKHNAAVGFGEHICNFCWVYT